MDADTLLHRYLKESVRFKTRLGLTLPKGFSYLGGEDYVLDRGSRFRSEAFSNEEKTFLLNVLRHCPLKRFPLGHCFHNAQIVVASDKSNTLQYCEGWAMGLTGLPTLHGWVLLEGKVLDLTWRVAQRARGFLGDRVWGVIPVGWAYYGTTFSTSSVLTRVALLGAANSFLDDVAHGFPLFQEPRLCPSR